MEEKIKIGLSKELYELLQKDCRDFKILKANGTPNMNAFLCNLILHYYETFCGAEESLNDRIKATLCDLPKKQSVELFSTIKKIINEKQDGKRADKNNISLSFKPTKHTQNAVFYIESILPSDESLSSFYRRMFASYAAKPKNEREKIIFRSTYEALLRAQEKGCQVMFRLNTLPLAQRASVYAVSASKDELFNYLLAFDGKKNRTVRLASIESVHLLSEPASIPQKNASYFARQIECGAQYPIYNTDDEPIRVQLTDKGKTLFEKIYLYRPTPISVDGDIYTFECSANQALYYFERFGETALILSPKKLGIFMRNYYYFAYKKYNKTYKDS